MLKNLLYLSAFSAFVVVVIIGLEIYHNYKTSSLEPRTQTRIIPIPPNFDSETIEELKKRIPVNVNLSERTNVISEDAQGLIPNIEIEILPDEQVASESGNVL